MKKEIEMNESFINDNPLNRRSSRYLKEAVFYSIARNTALSHFLELDPTEQTPKKLQLHFAPNAEFTSIMYKVGARKYPLEVKDKAEGRLFYDYTHVDYKKRRHFLDEHLPTKPLRTEYLEKVGAAVGFIIVNCFRYWWVFLILWIVYGVWIQPQNTTNPQVTSSHNRSVSGGGSNTFNLGGVSGGNPTPKAASDSQQVHDNSGKAGFGNPGQSGHDAPSSSSSEGQSSKQNAQPTSKKTNTLKWSYFVDNHELASTFIQNGDSVYLLAGQEVTIDIYLPISSNVVFTYNGAAIPGDGSESSTRIRVLVAEGTKDFVFDYEGSKYQLHLIGYQANCFRSNCAS